MVRKSSLPHYYTAKNGMLVSVSHYFNESIVYLYSILLNIYAVLRTIMIILLYKSNMVDKLAFFCTSSFIFFSF